MKRIKLQDKVPYQDSITWGIQNNYYRKQGKNAWKLGHVPFNISSNYRHAFQLASVIFLSLKLNRDRDRKILITELGSGSAVFALNFLRALENTCEYYGSDIFKKVHYMVTDYSEQNLADAFANEQLQQFYKKGLLGFYLLEATDPGSLKPYRGSLEKFNKGSVSAIVANYLFCNLPLALLKKEGGKFLEKRLATYIRIDGPADENKISHYLENPEKYELLSSLETEASYEEIDFDRYITDEREKATITDYVKGREEAFVNYPFAAFKSVCAFLEILKPDGLFLISDKCFEQKERFFEKENPAINHFNSYSHSVDFPLLENFALHLGVSAMQTDDRQEVFNTLLISKGKVVQPEVAGKFRELFISSNQNVEMFRYYRAGQEYTRKQDFLSAAGNFKKVLEYNPEDPKVYYNIGSCYLSTGDFDRALHFFQEGAKYDYFGFYEFDLVIGLCLMNRKEFAQALVYLQKAFETSGPSSKLLFSMGLCQQSLGNFEEARNLFIQAEEY